MWNQLSTWCFTDICCSCSYRSEFLQRKYHTGIRFTQLVAFFLFSHIIRGPFPFIDLLNPVICTWIILFPVFCTCRFLFLCVGHSHFDVSPVFLHKIINHSSHFPWNCFIVSHCFFFQIPFITFHPSSSDSFLHIYSLRIFSVLFHSFRLIFITLYSRYFPQFSSFSPSNSCHHNSSYFCSEFFLQCSSLFYFIFLPSLFVFIVATMFLN